MRYLAQSYRHSSNTELCAGDPCLPAHDNTYVVGILGWGALYIFKKIPKISMHNILKLFCFSLFVSSPQHWRYYKVSPQNAVKQWETNTLNQESKLLVLLSLLCMRLSLQGKIYSLNVCFHVEFHERYIFVLFMCQKFCLEFCMILRKIVTIMLGMVSVSILFTWVVYLVHECNSVMWPKL